jgi:hypothetical protein
VTTKTRYLVPAAAALLGLAVATALWLYHGAAAPGDGPPPDAAPPVSAQAAPAEQPTDPQVLGQIREAYQKSLAENAPPGMIELMQGSGSQPGDLPPLPDPFVVPAGHQGGPTGDLPPLPPSADGTPKPLPPLDAAPVARPAQKEGPSPDLPPLPPNK